MKRHCGRNARRKTKMALTNSYLKSVYETVEKRNPNEPEFQQAVYEVLESLEPVARPSTDSGFRMTCAEMMFAAFRLMSL